MKIKTSFATSEILTFFYRCEPLDTGLTHFEYGYDYERGQRDLWEKMRKEFTNMIEVKP